MTIDKSLRRKGRLSRSRNVLKRHERIEQMKTEERWPGDGRSPLGLPKTKVAKSAVGKKKKKAKEEEGAAAAPGAAPAPAAAAAEAKKPPEKKGGEKKK